MGEVVTVWNELEAELEPSCRKSEVLWWVSLTIVERLTTRFVTRFAKTLVVARVEVTS